MADILAAIASDAAGDAAAAVEPVGQGTIRLLGRADGPARQEDAEEAQAPSAAAGFDPRADILAALATSAE